MTEGEKKLWLRNEWKLGAEREQHFPLLNSVYFLYDIHFRRFWYERDALLQITKTSIHLKETRSHFMSSFRTRVKEKRWKERERIGEWYLLTSFKHNRVTTKHQKCRISDWVTQALERFYTTRKQVPNLITA